MKIKIPVEISARHIHLSRQDVENLFGQGYKLKKIKELTQPCDFYAQETVNLKIGDKKIENVRVVGPEREKTQIEISLTDAVFFGINPPVRLSGDLSISSPAVLLGPEGEVNLNEGLIIAQRHIHCATSEAKKLKLKNGQQISVKIESERPVTFHNVKVRVKDDYVFCLHLDTDEGNAAGVNKKGIGEIIQ